MGGLRCVRGWGNHNVVIHVTSKGRKGKGGSNWVRGRRKHLCYCQRVMSESVVEALFGCLSVCPSACLFTCLSRWLQKELKMQCAVLLKILCKLWRLGKYASTGHINRKSIFFLYSCYANYVLKIVTDQSLVINTNKSSSRAPDNYCFRIDKMAYSCWLWTEVAKVQTSVNLVEVQIPKKAKWTSGHINIIIK